MKKNLDIMYKGFLIGSTMLVPGVSGGSMAILLGIYEKLLSTISSFAKNIKENLLFLLLFVIGAGIGMLVLAKPILSLLESYPKPMQCFFIGAVAGGIPAVWKQADVKKVTWKSAICFGIGMLIVVGMSFLPTEALQSNISVAENPSPGINNAASSYIFLIFAGIIASVALVLPGISVSYFLLVLGLYHELMRAISEMDLNFLMPIGGGIVLGVLLTTRGLEHLLHKYPQTTYLVILGFVAGSVLEILPKLPQGREWFLCIATLLIGFFFITMLAREEG